MYLDVLTSIDIRLSNFSGLSLMFGLLGYLFYQLFENHKVDGSRYGEVKNISIPKSHSKLLIAFSLIFSSLGVFGLLANI